MNNIAFNIKSLRKEKGLSQEQFAQALHVTRQTVSSWERGMSQPGLELLQQMAGILGVNPEQLLYGPEKGEKLWRRRVSFLSVLTVIPVYLILFFFLFTLFSVFNFGTDLSMFGDVALAVIIMYCYCTLKDEIRNREYYNKTEESDEQP